LCLPIAVLMARIDTMPRSADKALLRADVGRLATLASGLNPQIQNKFAGLSFTLAPNFDRSSAPGLDLYSGTHLLDPREQAVGILPKLTSHSLVHRNFFLPHAYLAHENTQEEFSIAYLDGIHFVAINKFDLHIASRLWLGSTNKRRTYVTVTEVTKEKVAKTTPRATMRSILLSRDQKLAPFWMVDIELKEILKIEETNFLETSHEFALRFNSEQRTK
jgi:hypothetical protein